MKIEIDDVEVFSLTDTQLKVYQHCMRTETYKAELNAKLIRIFEEKITNCFGRMKKEWMPKLIADGAESIPTNRTEFTSLVFNHVDYKDRSAVNAEQEEV